jgi:hypothetical protein
MLPNLKIQNGVQTQDSLLLYVNSFVLRIRDNILYFLKDFKKKKKKKNIAKRKNPRKCFSI